MHMSHYLIIGPILISMKAHPYGLWSIRFLVLDGNYVQSLCFQYHYTLSNNLLLYHGRSQPSKIIQQCQLAICVFNLLFSFSNEQFEMAKVARQDITASILALLKSLTDQSVAIIQSISDKIFSFFEQDVSYVAKH